MASLLEKKQEAIEKALGVAAAYAFVDGEHHKTWVIDQMVRRLTSDQYDDWVAHWKMEIDDEHDEDTAWAEWETGIAP